MAAAVKSIVEETLAGANPSDADSNFSAHTRANFGKYAREDESGESYMTEEEFVDAIVPRDEDYHKIKRAQYGILFRVADRSNAGRINLQDWAIFEDLLSKPDAEYEIAFRLFDPDGTGTIKYGDFLQMYKLSKGEDSIPFDWDCEWASLYIGGKRKRHDMTYPQFAQMLRGLQGERIRQAFHYLDKSGSGYIEPEEFRRIILETAKHKLSDHLLDNLHTLCNISPGSKISYANVRAFQNVIQEIDFVDLIVKSATEKAADGKITRTDFLNEAARIARSSLFTPMEADILFHFASLDEPSGRLSLSDFVKVLDASWRAPVAIVGELTSEAAATTRTLLHKVLTSAHHFALGSMAGAFGAFMVYPIDLVKTRLQNQRSQRVGEMLYKNSIDCATKVVKNEGFRGLYSGVLPQLIGVAPEKAIKLTVNDLVRGKFTDQTSGKIWWPHELIAGGTAGACQVIFTNPLEIVKIRLQVQGEVAKKVDGVPRRSALWIVRNLGLMGLYKGASACLLRDIPFSAIYFPTYNHLKRDYFGETPQRPLGVLKLLTAGAIAGMPAAYLTTPFDVIKTRLQVEARKGETKYLGLRHCAMSVYREEGIKAFFKGGPARIMRSSPQFGFTLAAYEVLQTLLPMPGDEAAAAAKNAITSLGMGKDSRLPLNRSRNAMMLILDLDENFGRPRGQPPKGWSPPVLGGKAGVIGVL
ncbi:MAG: mitochondrial aspartate-glutamate transporter agc1 [Geoglossum umbratile]|nr:MAG: mitochondrial aspartate-glutamate transporter agc1 [Geoglossum umbratile]